MKSCTLVLTVLLAACGDDGGTVTTDGGPRPDAAPTCAPKSAPLSDGEHQLYLSFEGVTLTLGDCDDASTNCSSLVADASTVVPKFLANDGNRQTRITTIAGMVQDALAPFSVDVVTTRPAGSYWMASIGGTADAVAGLTDVPLAVKPVCDATNVSSISLVFERLPETTDRAYADTIAGSFGGLVGLVPTTQSGDCMCLASSCAHAQTCTWGTGGVAVSGNACTRTTQNEQQLMIAAVGCR